MAAPQDVFKPQFWSNLTLAQLYPKLRMAQMVYRDFNDQIAKEGDTVNTRMPNTFVAQNVDPDNFSSQNPDATNVEVKMDQWKHVTFGLSDKDISLSMTDLESLYATPAAEALTESIEDALMREYVNFNTYVGTAGNTPSTIEALGTNIRQKFEELNIPAMGRRVILNPAAENKFNTLFYQAQVSGSANQQTEGELVRKFGQDYVPSNKLPRHTTGMAGTVTANGGTAANSPTFAVTGLTSAPKKGDLFTLDHGGVLGIKQYVVTADAVPASGAAALSIYPTLRATVAGAAPVTVVGTHDVNLAFHKDAIALVSRPLNIPDAPGANVTVAEYNGIGLRAATWYEPKAYKTYVRLDILFGTKTLDARKGMRVLG